MTLDHAGFGAWLDRYVAAWKSYDPAAIGDLFSDDCAYRYHPLDEPVIGRDAIVADWLSNQDAPGTYDAAYEPLAIDGEEHVARGWSRYLTSEGEVRDEYSNIYVCRFDGDGRCSAFTEYWIQTRRFARAAMQAAREAAVKEAMSASLGS